MVLTDQLSKSRGSHVDPGASLALGERLLRLHEQNKIVLLEETSVGELPVVPRQRQRRLCAAERVALVQAYRAGATMGNLAMRFGVHEMTVSKCLRDLAVPLRRQPLGSEQRAEAIRLYEDGWSMNRIGDQLGCAHTTIRNVLIEEGVPRRDSHGRVR